MSDTVPASSTWGTISPRFQRLQRVRHVMTSGPVGIVTAFAARSRFLEYEVRWDLDKVGWYTDDELEPAEDKGHPGFWPGQADS